jgi:hypothetical protein
MNRTSFVRMLGSLPLFPLLSRAKSSEDTGKNVTAAEPLEALDKILELLAKKFGATIETCEGGGKTHTRSIRTIKLPQQFNSRDWWVVVHTQTITHSDMYIELYAHEVYTWKTLSLHDHPRVHENTHHELCNFIKRLGGPCTEGRFGIDVSVSRAVLKDTGETILRSTQINFERRISPEHVIHSSRRWCTDEVSYKQSPCKDSFLQGFAFFLHILNLIYLLYIWKLKKWVVVLE